jgi:hypothetical protein
MMRWQRLLLWGDGVPRKAFVGPIGSLFGLGGSEGGSQEAELARQREQQRIELERQRGEAQRKEQETDLQAGRAMRIPRGRRLLLAATGEAGLPGTLGG